MSSNARIDIEVVNPALNLIPKKATAALKKRKKVRSLGSGVVRVAQHHHPRLS